MNTLTQSTKSGIRAVNIENLRRLKRALQRQKLKRIDSYRIQVARLDQDSIPFSLQQGQILNQHQVGNLVESSLQNIESPAKQRNQKTIQPDSLQLEAQRSIDIIINQAPETGFQDKPYESEDVRQDLRKDVQGNFFILAFDQAGTPYYKPFRLLSNTAVTTIEMTTNQESDPFYQPQRSNAPQARSDNPIINESSIVSADSEAPQNSNQLRKDGQDVEEETKEGVLNQNKQTLIEEDSAAEQDKEMSEPAQKQVFIKVNSIEIEDKTTKVINKLRKMNQIYNQLNQLKYAGKKLNDFKCRILALRSEALRNNCKCSKLSSAIQICRHRKRRQRPGEANQLGFQEELFIQESPNQQDSSETVFKPFSASDQREVQRPLDEIELYIDQVKQASLGPIKPM